MQELLSNSVSISKVTGDFYFIYLFLHFPDWVVVRGAALRICLVRYRDPLHGLVLMDFCGFFFDVCLEKIVILSLNLIWSLLVFSPPGLYKGGLKYPPA